MEVGLQPSYEWDKLHLVDLLTGVTKQLRTQNPPSRDVYLQTDARRQYITKSYLHSAHQFLFVVYI